MSGPIVRIIRNGDVYIRVSSTLSFIMHRELWVKYVDACTSFKEFVVPVYCVTVPKRNKPYVVIPPAKIRVPYEVFETMCAGFYVAYPISMLDKHGNTDMISAKIVRDADNQPELKDAREAEIEVESVLEAYETFEYTTVAGGRVRIVHLPDAVFGRRVRGYGYTPTAVVLGARGIRPGDVVKAYWLMSKHGRGDFIDSGTSHQVDIYVVVT